MGKFSPTRPAARGRPERSRPESWPEKRDRVSQSPDRRSTAGARPSTGPAQRLTAARQMGQGLKSVWAIGLLVGQFLGYLIWHGVRLSFKLSRNTFRLLRRYPAIGLLTGWAILVGMAIAATTVIMNPEASVDLQTATRPQPTPPALQQTQLPRAAGPLANPELTAEPATPEPRPPVRDRSAASYPPIAAFIIIFSCSAGCLLLLRCLQPRSVQPSRRPDLANSSRQRPTQPPVSAPSPVSEPMLPSVLFPPKLTAPEPVPAFELSLPAQLEAPVYDGPLLTADETDSEPLDFEEASPVGSDDSEAVSVTAVSVTVIQEGQDHPLDWNEPSLADSLDLRQRRPLSYWLEGG
jgi:hypothetical protein